MQGSAPVWSSGTGTPLLNESMGPCSRSEHVPLIKFCKSPMPVCKMRGMLPIWRQAVKWSTRSRLFQEDDGESVSRDLRIDQVLERLDRGGGTIDMLRNERVISKSVDLNRWGS